jgi:PAS domain S-box-containing protein
VNPRLRDLPKYVFFYLGRGVLDQQRFAKRSLLLRYGVSACAVAIAVLIKVLLEPLIVQETPFLLIFLAILFSAWYGGLGPGLAATAGAALITAYFFLPPLYSLTAFDIKGVPLSIFLLEGVLLSLIIAALRSAQHRAEANALEVQRRQEDLRQSEERYRVVTETASDAIFMIDINSQILFVNDAAERIFGYASDEMIGKRLTMLMPEHLRGAHQAALKRYVETRKRRLDWEVLELTGLHKSGKEIPLEVSFGEALREGEHFFTGFVRDITERKRYEEELRATQERFRLLVEGVEDYAIFMLDADGHVASWNVGSERIKGYRAEEIIGEHFSVFYPEEDVKRGKPDYELRVAADEGAYEAEGMRVRKDGSRFWGSVHTRPLRDEAGNLRGFSKVTRDITERKRAEQNLQDTLDRLLALYEASQFLGSTLESEEVVSRLLEIMQRVSNLTAAVISLQEEDGRERVWRSVGLESLSQRARHAPEAVHARRAALETAEYQLFRLQDPDSGTERLLGLCLPLLTRDRNLGVLEAYGSESLAESDAVELLGSLASQAASALENARLYGELADREQRLQDLVEKMMVAQEEERRHVAYEVHDGLAQIAVAAHTYLNAFARQNADEAIKGREKLDRALELIEQTVEEARRVIADLRPTALDDFGLATALRLYVEELRSEECETSYEEALGDERLPIPVETALFRVAQEALTNVRKHADTSRVHLTLERLDKSVRLEVRDWGRGFELEKDTTKGGPGERVGLVGMQERITLFGGDLEVRSQPGAGTSVVAEVPLYEDTPGEDNDDRER